MRKLSILFVLLCSNLVFAETKDLGPGTISNVVFLHVTVPNGSVSKAKVEYTLSTADGTNYVGQVGTAIFNCTADINGVTGASKTQVGVQNEAGVGVSPTLLLSSMSFSVSTALNSCDFKISNAVLAGTPTSNILTYDYTTQGAGSWNIQ